jgi:cysteine desulfuration protein SufE
MSVSLAMPARLAEIIDDFELAEGREKLELLLEYSDNLPPLPDWVKEKGMVLEEVPECLTPVSVAAELQDGGLVYYFLVPPESPTVRGFASIVAEGLRSAPPDQVIGLPADFYLRMGLQKVLTPQRMHGMAAIVAHVKRLAVEKLDK